MRKGIDISSHQGIVDFQKVKKAGYDFVIIKAGQGNREFDTFKRKAEYLYQPKAEAAGLDWGAYWWSDAVSVEEAKEEARAFLAALKGLRPTFPVYMDQEYESPCGKWGPGRNNQLRTDMVEAFLDTLGDAGYYAALYSSTDWLQNYVNADQLTAYDKWVADYRGKCHYTGEYGIWQYSSTGRVDGIGVPVDLNECYQDYPGIIKSNGWNNWPESTPADKPTGYVADWGEVGDILKNAGITEIKL